jgi:hypothetical protein
MSYSLIEDITDDMDITNSNKYPPKMNSDVAAWKMALSGRPDVPSAYGMERRMERYNQPTQPVYYQERAQPKTPISELISESPNPMSEPAVAKSDSQTTDLSSNNVVLDYLRKVGLYMKETTNYFAEREQHLSKKVEYLEQLLKGVAILLIILLVFLMVRK